MAVTLDKVLDRAAAATPDADRQQLERTVREVIAACGLDVAPSGEVYNPAEGAYRPRLQAVPRDQRWAGRRR